MIALLPMAQAGSVKPLAITGKTRSKLAPEIPTTAESGMPGLDIHSWYAVWGPKGMPDELVKRLNGVINEITAELARDGKLDALGIDVVAGVARTVRALSSRRCDAQRQRCSMMSEFSAGVVAIFSSRECQIRSTRQRNARSGKSLL